MDQRHPSLSRPTLWLITDARNDTGLEAALRALPRGSGVVFRHYHLPEPARRARFLAIKRLCASRGLKLVLAGDARMARAWGAGGCYGAPARIAPGPATFRLATAHSLRELGQAGGRRADAVLLSPVWPTRSHAGARTLGPVRFLLCARQGPLPVLALGGVTPSRARALKGAGWAAIDGLSRATTRRISKDS